MEGVRARAASRHQRQRRDHLHHRERGSDGRAHRRLRDRGPIPDADRQAVPAHAGCGDQDDAKHRHLRRGLQRAIRHPARHRPPHRHRDQPTREPKLGVGLESHGLPHRQSGHETGRRVQPRRAEEPDHRHHQRLLRAEHRLCGLQSAALQLREIPRCG